VLGYDVSLPRYGERKVCTSPCEVQLEKAAELVVRGDGVVPTEPFLVTKSSDLEVVPGSTRLRATSMGFFLGAVIFGTAGIASLITDLARRDAIHAFTVAALITYAVTLAIGGTLFELSVTSVKVR
jgi:hypothetical protein